MWQQLVDLLFPNPSMCVLCEKKMDDLALCADCLARWQTFAEREGQCRRCGHFGVHGSVCDTCRSWPAYFRGNVALLPYTGEVREAIVRFKFGGEPWRAAGFAPLFAQRPAPAVDAIVPVPLHKHRQQARGYNQSLLLAREMAACWELPLLEHALLRVVDTPHQIGLSRAARTRNLAGAFAVSARGRAAIAGKRLLVVDDVMTTGSTLLACARTLHKAGAREVESMTLAAGIR